MRALVSGASGFLGRYLMAQLDRCGVPAARIGRAEVGQAPWRRDVWAPVIEASQADVVFHLAGTATADEAALNAINVGSTEGLLAAVRDSARPPRVVLIGSAAEYGPQEAQPVSEAAACNPVSAYGRSKLRQTELGLAAHSALTPVLVARPFNPIGAGMPRHLALGDFAAQIAAMPRDGGVLHTGALDDRRDFADADQTMRAIAALGLGDRGWGEVINVCSGEDVALRGLVEKMIAASGKKVRIEVDPARIRSATLSVFYGSPARLRELGYGLPPADYDALVLSILAASGA